MTKQTGQESRHVEVQGMGGGGIADQTFASLLRVMRLMQSNMQQLEHAEGLSGAQLLALWQLSVNHKLSVSELASALHLHRSSTSNMLDKLEARGLVSRNRQTYDQRIVIINLTQSGWDVVQRVPGPMGGVLRQTISLLPAPVMQHLHDGVSALVDVLDRPALVMGDQATPG